MNPEAGDGKVARHGLVREARRRGIAPIVLGPGDDVRRLAQEAVARGAEVLGMAGGDGSLAPVAEVAAQHDVAFVCVPAGTRNHLAMDLGLDRGDVVGALDAFGDAVERRVDLGLRVRIPPHAPGCSPAATAPRPGRATITALLQTAAGRPVALDAAADLPQVPVTR